MSTNLITIDEFKTYKDVNSDKDDAIISLLIAVASDFIKEYIGRDLIDYATKNKIEYFDGTSYPEYYPDETPLLEVSELAVSADGGVTYTILTEDEDYFVDLEDDRIIANTGLEKFVTSSIAHKSCKLTYKGGYAEAPYSLKVATMDLVNYYRKEEHSPSKAMSGASIENPEQKATNHLPPHIKRVLDLYRNI